MYGAVNRWEDRMLPDNIGLRLDARLIQVAGQTCASAKNFKADRYSTRSSLRSKTSLTTLVGGRALSQTLRVACSLKDIQFLFSFPPLPEMTDIKYVGIPAKLTILCVKFHCVRKVLMSLMRQRGRQ